MVVGAGRVAEEKIEGLLRAGAKVRVVAPEATERIRELARKKKLRWDARGFRSTDLEGAFVAVAATSSASLHAGIYREARRRGVLCNVVDDPEHCDFYYGSVVRRGELQIAISTAGRSPALAQRLRKKLEREFGEEYAEWLKELGEIRDKLFDKEMPAEKRRALLHSVASEASLKEFLGRKKRKSRD